MRSKLFAGTVRRIAHYFGYVPISDLKALESELRDKITSEANSHVRGQLSEMLLRLVSFQELHEKQCSGTQKAVDKLDRITESLLGLMKDVWPAAYSLDDPPLISMETDNATSEEADRLCCHGQPVGDCGAVDGGYQGCK